MIQSIQKIDIYKYSYLGSVFLVFFILYFDYFKYDPLLGRDDSILAIPIMSLDSISDYFQKSLRNEILDVQPLRDLTFWINIKINNWFKISTFHLLNFGVFFILVILVFQLFQILFEDIYFPYLFSLVFAVHPIMVSSVGWVSARKHSLATMFVLIGITNFLKNKKINYVTVISYILSLCAHQIYFLIPAWFLLYSRLKRHIIEKNVYFILCLSGVLIVGIGFYKTFILNIGQNIYSEKDSYYSNLSRYILSLGRSFVLVFFPKSIAAAYYQGSFWNLVGIPLGVLFTFGVLKEKKHREDILIWLFLALSAFIPTIITFVNDSYLYLILVSILICIAYFIKSINYSRYALILKFIFIGYIILFLFKTIEASGIWMSNAKLWQYSYLNEKSPYNAIVLSSHIEKEETSLELLIWAAGYFDFSRNYHLRNYFTHRVYFSTVINREEKIKIFKKYYYDLPIWNLYLALLNIDGNVQQAKNGVEILKKINSFWNSGNPKNILNRRFVESTIKKICKSKIEKRFVCQELGINFKEKK